MRADPTARALAALLDDDHPGDADRVDRIVAAVPGPSLRLRIVLAVLAAAHAVVTLPWLVGRDPFSLLGDDHAAHGVHLARDGALGVAIVASAALTAWRPRWAVPAAVIAGVALVAQVVAGVADGTIRAMALEEVVHVLAVATTVLVARAATRLRPLGPRRRPALRAVPDTR